MDYRPYVASSTIDLVVNDHIVTCGSTTWQIRNIAATVVDRIVIPFNEPEPRFNTAEPGLRVPWRGIVIGASLLWAAVHFGLNFPRVAIFAAMAVGVVACFMAVRDLSRRKAD